LLRIDEKLIARLFHVAKGERWRAPIDGFASALAASADRAFAGQTPRPRDVERYLSSLHLEDLALASACSAGDEEAWGHFVLELRPSLYRAADALDPSGGARELADSLYADLFGLGQRGGDGQQPLFRYFHGRSSLATWLRAVLAQRHVDRQRTLRRTEPLPDEESAAALSVPARSFDPGRRRSLDLLRRALTAAVAALVPRDRLRLACYYAQDLTLAQTGRLLGEHEATASRQLARTRKQLRESVERRLHVDAGLSRAEIAECFADISADAGTLDLDRLLGVAPDGKESSPDRSNGKEGRAP
jgi:RNA polymerase sigma-70 factor (ECF subfamily)